MINTKYRFSFLATLLVVFSAVLFSCTEDDNLTQDTEVGNPTIDFIRSTDAEVSDSLLTGAFMGQLIALVGNDLDNTVEIWFNDQQASLTPTFITNTSIIVRVPSSVPGEVTDEMILRFSDGSEKRFDFKVNVPSPELDAIKSMHVETGDIAVLHGDFFFEPITVTFADGIEAEIAVLEKTKLEVIVPAGAEKGAITITTNFGEAISEFIFREDDNTIVNADDLLHRDWNAPVANVNMGEGLVPACSGNYVELKSAAEVGAWTWDNSLNLMYIAEDPITGRGDLPLFPGEANVNEWGVRFEINVQFDWREVPLEVFFAEYENDHGRDFGAAIAQWRPWEETGLYTTDGWETVTIPLTDFNINSAGDVAELGDLGKYTNMTLMLFGDAVNKHMPYIAIDNVRIIRI